MQPNRIVVLGVSGVGKTTVGSALAERLGLPFIDGDDLHTPQARAKMAAGVPLDDADRAAWLRACGVALAAPPAGAVLASSALARRYRDAIRERAPGALFVLLAASEQTVAERIAARKNHFMPLSLLASQFAALEPLEPDENGFTVAADAPLERVLDQIQARIRSK